MISLAVTTESTAYQPTVFQIKIISICSRRGWVMGSTCCGTRAIYILFYRHKTVLCGKIVMFKRIYLTQNQFLLGMWVCTVLSESITDFA
jgi:hypothetical protein